MVLRPNAHSIGIMRGKLLQEDWTKAAQGTLGFTRSQKQQIRTWIAERHAVLDRIHVFPAHLLWRISEVRNEPKTLVRRSEGMSLPAQGAAAVCSARSKAKPDAMSGTRGITLRR